MKKILFILIMILLAFPVTTKAIVTNSSSNIKVNVFYEKKCKNCDQEKEWLEEYNKNAFINIEYFNIADNKELYAKTRSALNIKKDKLPLVVIGTDYFIDFNETVKNSLITAIISYEENTSYCDAVTKLKNNEEIKECINQNKNIYKKSNVFLTFLKILFGACIICVIIIFRFVFNKKRNRHDK